jgi:predicted Zn-dependent protease
VSIESLLARYLAECGRLGIHGEIRAVEQQRAEIVARNGTVESEGLTSESLISLTVSDGTGWAVLAGGTDVDPATMVAEGRALLRRTSGQADGRAPVVATGTGTRHHPGRRVPINENRDRIGATSVLPAARECELRSIETARTVHYATPDGTQSYPTSHASLVFRATRSGQDGESIHVDRGDSGSDLNSLLDQLAEREVQDCGRELLAAEFPASLDLPATVVIGRHVAAQLLWLFGEALSGEAVVQRRSRLAGHLGQQVSSPLITITDDPCYPGGPRHLPIDDEGIQAERRVLIEQGQLRAFLGSRGYQFEGARAGNGRQPDEVTAPRPAASNFLVQPGPDPIVPDGPALWITQTHGMHLSNPITGDFSAGGTGLVLDDGRARRATGLTVAANVFDIFRNTDAVGDRLCWADDAESSFGSPDLRVSGLTIGR